MLGSSSKEKPRYRYLPYRSARDSSSLEPCLRVLNHRIRVLWIMDERFEIRERRLFVA